TGELLLHGGTTITSQNASPGPAIAGTGNLAIDPDTVLQGFTNPPFDPNLTVVSRTIPGLDAAAGTLGGNASATLAVPAGATGVLFVGFAATPTFVPGLLDPLWLAGPVRMAVGGAPTVTASYAVPNATWVRGLQIAWRGAVLTGGGAIELSNPALYAHL
ncbi:MAG: hypothetical protein KDE27_10115, partial [Planctomycetes bacterium]|nr:hypothetical protein [Planctomycetota bacterium]